MATENVLVIPSKQKNKVKYIVIVFHLYIFKRKAWKSLCFLLVLSYQFTRDSLLHFHSTLPSYRTPVPTLSPEQTAKGHSFDCPISQTNGSFLRFRLDGSATSDPIDFHSWTAPAGSIFLTWSDLSSALNLPVLSRGSPEKKIRGALPRWTCSVLPNCVTLHKWFSNPMPQFLHQIRRSSLP